MTHEPAPDTLSGEPELILKYGSVRWNGQRHAFQVFYNGGWKNKHAALPTDLYEKLDACYRHLKEPTKHPWPDGD